MLNVVAEEIGPFHVDFDIRNDKGVFRMSCGCCGGANHKDMEFPDKEVLTDYASAMNACLVREGITPTAMDGLSFCLERPPAFREAIEIVERTMNVRRKSVVRKNKAKRTISLTAPAQFRGNFLMLISRLPYFENTLITDRVFQSKYTSMLQELVSAIEDKIVPYRVCASILEELVSAVEDRIVPYREAAEFDSFEINLDDMDWYTPDDM